MTADPETTERLVDLLDRLVLVLDRTEKLLKSMEMTDAIITAELFPERARPN